MCCEAWDKKKRGKSWTDKKNLWINITGEVRSVKTSWLYLGQKRKLESRKRRSGGKVSWYWACVEEVRLFLVLYDEGRDSGMRSVSLIKVWVKTTGFPIYSALFLMNSMIHEQRILVARKKQLIKRILAARRKQLIKRIPAQIRYKVFTSCFRIQSYAERPYRPTRDNSDVNNIHPTSLFVVVSLQAHIFYLIFHRIFIILLTYIHICWSFLYPSPRSHTNPTDSVSCG